MPIYKRIDEIDKTYLESLVEDEVLEDRGIEYKQELNILKDLPPKEKKEAERKFCGEISAFANADGGYLIVGIADDKGMPQKDGPFGIDEPEDFDRLKLKIHDIIDRGVEPQLHGVDIVQVKLNEEKVALVIHISSSWSKPHWVGEKGCRTFYTRTSGGKDHLDIRNVRELFVLSETMVERIRNFRNARINAIEEGEPYIPQNFGDIPKTVLHIVPIGSAASFQAFDISTLSKMFRDSFAKYGFNMEGIFGINQMSGRVYDYFQVCQNGTIEFVDGELVDGNGILSALNFESRLFNEIVPRIVTFQKALGVNPPYIVMLSLMGIGNHKLSLTKCQRERLRKTVGDSMYHRQEHVHFDRPSCMFPEIVIESLESANIHLEMRPVLDVVWQAAGLPRSFSYKEDGTWDGEEKGQNCACP